MCSTLPFTSSSAQYTCNWPPSLGLDILKHPLGKQKIAMNAELLSNCWKAIEFLFQQFWKNPKMPQKKHLPFYYSLRTRSLMVYWSITKKTLPPGFADCKSFAHFLSINAEFPHEYIWSSLGFKGPGPEGILCGLYFLKFISQIFLSVLNHEKIKIISY